MRADRLVATLLLLQARGRVTAAEVAEELEISVKTARRDLEALSMAGIPVYSQSGRGGGWSLVGGARTDLSGLTAAEARTLFLIAGPSATIAPDAKAALRKLVQALPETFRADAEAAASAVVLDPAAWGNAGQPRSPHLEPLERAVIDGVQVRLAYADLQGTRTDRLVHPLGLARKQATWYLIANTDAGLRTFRVERIQSVTLTDAPVARPAGFDLEAAWRSAVSAFEERLTGVRAVVRVPAATLPWLRGQFGRALAIRSRVEDRIEAEVRGPSAEWIAQQLAGWGGDVEVVRSPDVRAQLARIGAQLVARHTRGQSRSTDRRMHGGGG